MGGEIAGHFFMGEDIEIAAGHKSTGRRVVQVPHIYQCLPEKLQIRRLKARCIAKWGLKKPYAR